MSRVTADQPMPAALKLAYAPADRSGRASGRRRWRVLSLVALSPGLILPFLPVTCDASAAEVVWNGGASLITGNGLELREWALWLLAIPYFLIFPLVYWRVLQLTGRSPTGRVRVTAFVLGGLGAVALLGMVVAAVWAAGGLSGDDDWPLLCAAILALALVGVLETVLLTRPWRRDDQVTVALAGPYAIALAFCVVAWLSSHDFGWYFAISPAAAGLIELVVIAKSLWGGAGTWEVSPPSG